MQAAFPLFDRVTIIGLGLIGSSIARAAHEHGIANTIIGCDSNEVSLAYGRKQGFIDVAAYDPATAVAESQLVILAAPTPALGEIARLIAPNLMHGAIVMDVASVKRAAIAAISVHLPEHVHFVPAHPIAGSEATGASAGRADLFQGKRIIITPDAPPEGELLQTVNSFWQRLGARVEGMPPALHDMVYAYVSHLPQLLAFGVKAPVGDVAAPGETLSRFLRLSSSSPELWAGIFSLNQDNLLNALDDYLNVIKHIHDELLDAPEDAPNERDETLARTRLFPRIVASCLVTTVMNAEKKAGFPFARFAGTGFADMTAPAIEAPDEDIERISNQFQAVRPVLREFIDKLIEKRRALAL